MSSSLSPVEPQQLPQESSYKQIILWRNVMRSATVFAMGTIMFWAFRRYHFVALLSFVSVVFILANLVLFTIRKSEPATAPVHEEAVNKMAAGLVPILTPLAAYIRVFGGLLVVWLFSRVISPLTIIFLVFLYSMTIPCLMEKFPEQSNMVIAMARQYFYLFLSEAVKHFHKGVEHVQGVIGRRPAPVAAPAAPAS